MMIKKTPLTTSARMNKMSFIYLVVVLLFTGCGRENRKQKSHKGDSFVALVEGGNDWRFPYKENLPIMPHPCLAPHNPGGLL